MLPPDLFSSITSGKKTIGIGSGQTITSLLPLLSKNTTYIPSSFNTHQNLISQNLTISSIDKIHTLDLYLDGADYYDSKQNFIKGKGGCLTQERFLMEISEFSYIFIQKYKYVDRFDDLMVPLEVMPFAVGYLEAIGAVVTQCKNRFGPTVTENGCYMMEIAFQKLDKVNGVTGVVSHGYFECDNEKYKIIEL